MKKRRIRILFILLLCISFLCTGCAGKDEAKKFNKKGMEAYKDGNYEEAAKKFEQAVTEKPENPEYHFNYGFALIGQKKTKEATDQFKKAISVNQGEKKADMEQKKKAYRGMGIAYFEVGAYKKSAANFTKALGIKESASMDVDILSYRADTYIGQGNYEKAIADYGKIIEETPKNADIYAKRAELLAKSKNPSAALLDYDQAISLDGKKPDYYIGKYYLQEKSGNTNAMLETMDTAIGKCDSGKAGAYQTGYLLFIKKDYDAAKLKLQKAQEDGYGKANYYLGEIAQIQGDTDAATAYYRQCITEENEKAAKSYNQLAALSIKQGNYDEASGFIKQGFSYHDLTVRRELKLNEIIICEQKGYWVKAKSKAEALMKLYPRDEEIGRELDFLNTRAKTKQK